MLVDEARNSRLNFSMMLALRYSAFCPENQTGQGAGSSPAASRIKPRPRIRASALIAAIPHITGQTQQRIVVRKQPCLKLSVAKASAVFIEPAHAGTVRHTVVLADNPARGRAESAMTSGAMRRHRAYRRLILDRQFGCTPCAAIPAAATRVAIIACAK